MHLLEELGMIAHRQLRQPVKQSQRNINPRFTGSGSHRHSRLIWHLIGATSGLLRALLRSGLMLHLLHHSRRGRVERASASLSERYR